MMINDANLIKYPTERIYMTNEYIYNELYVDVPGEVLNQVNEVIINCQGNNVKRSASRGP